MTDKNMLELEESIPSLTLTPELDAQAEAAEEAAPEVEPVFLDESAYTEAERKVIADFSEKIDITNATMVLQYGSAAQKKLSDFSESALGNVRTKDLGEVGGLVTDLEPSRDNVYFYRLGKTLAGIQIETDYGLNN